MSDIHDFDDNQISWKFAPRYFFVLGFHRKFFLPQAVKMMLKCPWKSFFGWPLINCIMDGGMEDAVAKLARPIVGLIHLLFYDACAWDILADRSCFAVIFSFWITLVITSLFRIWWDFKRVVKKDVFRGWIKAFKAQGPEPRAPEWKPSPGFLRKVIGARGNLIEI